MAFKKTIHTEFGFDVANAYFRVEGVRLIGKDKIQFQLRTSTDGVKPSFLDEQHECVYALDGSNPIAQAYVYLKTLSEFADAVDC
jgi:hypothetical protein